MSVRVSMSSWFSSACSLHGTEDNLDNTHRMRLADIKLFQAVMHGAYLSRGFRNSDLRERLHGSLTDPHERRRKACALSRMLKRLHVRGFIAKIPRTYRWRTTKAGQRLLGTILRLYHDGFNQAA